MRQFDKDKIMGCVVECSNGEQCRELIDWYIKEVNPNEVNWDRHPKSNYNRYGVRLEEDTWGYTSITYSRENPDDYKIITFNEALLEQTETNEGLVQEPKQVAQLRLNDEVALSKEDFIKYTVEGYAFEFGGDKYFYDDSYSNPFRFLESDLTNSVDLDGAWLIINSKNKFKVVKLPYESSWKKYKCIKNGIAYFVETDNLSNIKEYIQYDSIQEIIKEEN